MTRTEAEQLAYVKTGQDSENNWVATRADNGVDWTVKPFARHSRVVRSRD